MNDKRVTLLGAVGAPSARAAHGGRGFGKSRRTEPHLMAAPLDDVSSPRKRSKRARHPIEQLCGTNSSGCLPAWPEAGKCDSRRWLDKRVRSALRHCPIIVSSFPCQLNANVCYSPPLRNSRVLYSSVVESHDTRAEVTEFAMIRGNNV